MNWLMDALAVEPNPASRKRVDLAIRTALRLPDDVHCPEVWAAIKALGDDERLGLVPAVRTVLDAEGGAE